MLEPVGLQALALPERPTLTATAKAVFLLAVTWASAINAATSPRSGLNVIWLTVDDVEIPSAVSSVTDFN